MVSNSFSAFSANFGSFRSTSHVLPLSFKIKKKFWTGILFTNGSSTLQWWVSKNIELELWKSTFENQSGHQGQLQPILTLFPSSKPLLFSLYWQQGLYSKLQKPDKALVICCEFGHGDDANEWRKSTEVKRSRQRL